MKTAQDFSNPENRIKETVVRIATAGSVDDGKSTLIGRLLINCKGVYEDQIQAASKRSDAIQNNSMALAFLTDGLKAEREQGITIDVAYRHFSTEKRRFILADTPGHEQYTRNMATGASTADVSLILIDAKKGISTQTKRHAFICSLLGVPRFVVVVNKMDLVDYSESVFESIRKEFEEFARSLAVKEIRCIPISALAGDNVTERSPKTPWYDGETLLSYLDSVYVAGDKNLVDFRFPVQQTLRPNSDYRGYMGTIASGRVHVGDEVTILPSRVATRVSAIDLPVVEGEIQSVQEAQAGMAISLRLEKEVDISRGDVIARSLNLPQVSSNIDAMLVWMDETPLDVRRNYLIFHTTRMVRASISEIRYRVDVNTLHRMEPKPLELNEIGRVRIAAFSPLCFDSYKHNRSTGSFILIDAESFQTVAAGMIVDRRVVDKNKELETISESGVPDLSESLTPFIFPITSRLSRAQREAQMGGAAKTLWLTGLSASGKSTIGKQLEELLFNRDTAVFLLDGDNVRTGLCADLGFSAEDRQENLRRTAHLARTLNEAGVSVIASFISPLASDRALVRSILGEENYLEVFVKASLEHCEARDPKGLYKKARAGEIANFTGISAPYEEPLNPDLVLDTETMSVNDLAQAALQFFLTKSARG